MSGRKALVIGASGITGGATVERLLEDGWVVHGVSRKPSTRGAGAHHVAVDVLDAPATAAALGDLGVTHVFFQTWSRQPTEAENIVVNSTMLRNVLDAVGPAGTVQHAALVTGLKHYLGPFEAYAQEPAKPPFRESQPRLPVANFYYDQEDVLFAAAKRHGFTWSVHRPHTVIGYATGNAMNMAVTLGVYGALCRESGAPFVFPGSPEQYSSTTDITDARLLARHLVWAATSPAGADEAFNVTNGETFCWSDMWGVVAAGLGVEPAPYPGRPDPLEVRMDHAPALWRRVAEREGLVEPDVGRLASWWHTDSDLGRQVETWADMTKSREAGFDLQQDSSRSFLDVLDRLRAERVLPPVPDGSPNAPTGLEEHA